MGKRNQMIILLVSFKREEEQKESKLRSSIARLDKWCQAKNPGSDRTSFILYASLFQNIRLFVSKRFPFFVLFTLFLGFQLFFISSDNFLAVCFHPRENQDKRRNLSARDKVLSFLMMIILLWEEENSREGVSWQGFLFVSPEKDSWRQNMMRDLDVNH